ncbi:MAG: UrcA family protein [Gammaproteobacteria bacterium]
MNALTQAYPSSHWLAAFAALLCAVGAENAVAGPASDEPPSVTIRYSHLDLAKPAGAESLYRRIQAAARTVCGVNKSKELRQIVFAKDCYTATVANAVATINKPLVTALHRSKAVRTATG